jgi:hypothetical protein
MLSKLFVPAWCGFGFIKTPMMPVSFAVVAASLDRRSESGGDDSNQTVRRACMNIAGALSKCLLRKSQRFMRS